MTRLNTTSGFLNATAILKLVLFRMMVFALLSTGLMACATAPSGSATQASVPVELTPEFSSASTELKTRNYAEAVRQFDAIINDIGTPAEERRLAHLGKAMIYLAYDENWHSVNNARTALGDAAKVPVPLGESLDVETDLLMEAVLALIDSQTAYEAIKSKSGDTSYQINQLKKNNQSLVLERDGLQKENNNLNDALEKLKKLTLGN